MYVKIVLRYPGTLYVTVKSKRRKKSDLKPASEEKQQERSKSHNDLTNERTKKIAKEEPRVGKNLLHFFK